MKIKPLIYVVAGALALLGQACSRGETASSKVSKRAQPKFTEATPIASIVAIDLKYQHSVIQNNVDSILIRIPISYGNIIFVLGHTAGQLKSPEVYATETTRAERQAFETKRHPKNRILSFRNDFVVDGVPAYRYELEDHEFGPPMKSTMVSCYRGGLAFNFLVVVPQGAPKEIQDIASDLISGLRWKE